MKNSSRKKSFSLVEVMVASMIIAVVGTALLKTTSNNRLFLQRFDKINEQNQILSFVAFDDLSKISSSEDDTTPNDLTLVNDDYYLDDLLSHRYDFIKDDEVRKYYKNMKFHIKAEIVKETNSDEMGDMMASFKSEDDENQNNNQNMDSPPDIKIIKTTISNKNLSKYIHKLRVEF